MNPPLHLHFIGIGGIGMSAIARMADKSGYDVSGCDLNDNDQCKKLRMLNINCLTGNDPAHLEGVDVVVRSSAVHLDHPEIMQARKKHIPVFSRLHMLSRLMRDKRTVGIAGCHGKTTTTWLISHMLIKCGYDPTVMLGGNAPEIGGNFRSGKSEWFVSEVDESDGLFHEICPDFAIITNVDIDHLDHYRDLDSIEAAFRQYIHNVKDDGKVIVCNDDERAMRTVSICDEQKLITYGFNQKALIRAGEVELSAKGSKFTLFHKGNRMDVFTLKMTGEHNIQNALAAIAFGFCLNLNCNEIKDALSQCEGVERRMQIILEDKNFTVIDDYAHHPAEINVTLKTARLMTRRHLIGIFQPHRYSRTQKLADDFGRALARLDRLILAPIYPAGEKTIPGISSEIIENAVKKVRNIPCTLVGQMEDIPSILLKELKTGDVAIVMGAGDISVISRTISAEIKKLNSTHSRHIHHDAANRRSRKQGADPSISLKVGPELSRRTNLLSWPGNVRKDVPLAPFTSIRIGGKAEFFCEPVGLDELLAIYRYALNEKVPVNILGNGSNVLIPDAGIHGLVIHMGKGLDWQQRKGDRVFAGAGLELAYLIQRTHKWGLGGCGRLVGIPGTVGGAIQMNAGTQAGAIADIIHAVRIVDSRGEIKILNQKDLKFSYRSSNLHGLLILEGIFDLEPAAREMLFKESRDMLIKRKETQPLTLKNAGCIFKNPAGKSAGELIDRAGMKGLRVGGVKISEKHGNFIVNDEQGSEKDVKELIKKVTDKLKLKYGIKLEPELQFWKPGSS